MKGQIGLRYGWRVKACVTVTNPRDLPELKKRDERQMFVQHLLETR